MRAEISKEQLDIELVGWLINAGAAVSEVANSCGPGEMQSKNIKNKKEGLMRVEYIYL